MTANAVVSGVFADLKTVRTRSIVQMVIEIPVERAEEVVQMFGFPQPGAEVPVAVARLVQPVAPKVEQPTPDGPRFNDLPRAKQAGILCREPEFWRFIEKEYCAPGLTVQNADEAAQSVRAWCGVGSRADLSADPEAADQWDEMRDAYRAWQRDREGQEQAEAQAREYGRR